jgi:glycosyltransferase involved in cell wall biosynthesis
MAAENAPTGTSTAVVSVIIPAYNQGRFVAAAIESVLRQSLQAFEVIVVDDGSTDDTAAVVAGIKDPRVRCVRQSNRGLSAARNTGIRNSAGEFLSFLDSDDLFLPGKLEWLVAALKASPDGGIAAGQAVPIDEEGNRLGRPFETPLPDDAPRLLLGNPLHVGSVVVRKTWQERVGFFDESLRSYEDWDMWLRLVYAGCRTLWVPRPVSLYRFHRDQMTRIGTQMTRATFAVLEKFFAQPDLEPAWASMKPLAYGRANLRGAAQAFRMRDFDAAGGHLREAVKHDPSLLEHGGQPLADQFRSWTELPKIADPVSYLEDVYAHLPAELAVLSGSKRSRLGSVAAEFAFGAYTARDLARARRYALKALAYSPSLAGNVGLVSVLLRSVFGKS